MNKFDITPMAEAAASLHEEFLAFVEAGFTEAQACIILGSMLATMTGSSGSSGSSS